MSYPSNTSDSVLGNVLFAEWQLYDRCQSDLFHPMELFGSWCAHITENMGVEIPRILNYSIKQWQTYLFNITDPQRVLHSVLGEQKWNHQLWRLSSNLGQHCHGKLSLQLPAKAFKSRNVTCKSKPNGKNTWKSYCNL